jgi:hypothetical protein
MIRIKTWCWCCEKEVELYSDHLVVGDAKYRCGNCFEQFWQKDLAQAEKLHQELLEHEKKRDEIVAEYRRIPYAHVAKN